MKWVYLLFIPLLIFAYWTTWETEWQSWTFWRPDTSGSGPPTPPPTPPDPSEVVGGEWWRTCFPDSNAIGGGPGYSDTVSMAALSNNHSTSWIVGSAGTPLDTLIAALAALGAGDTIYIADTTVIDFGETEGTQLQAGVLLCSGRGTIKGDTISWGGIIKCSDYDDNMDYLFYTGGAGVVVTGLRIEGPNGEINDRHDGTYARDITGIQLQDANCRVHNCEIYNWPRAGIQITDVFDTCYVNNNYLHHIRNRGTGYPVVFSGQNHCIVYANYAETFRMFGADWDTTNRYTQHFNVWGHHQELQTMDRHAGGGYKGGKLTKIHNVTSKKFSTLGNQYNFRSDGDAWVESTLVYNCWLWEDDSTDAIKLYSNTNARVSDNVYGRTRPTGLDTIMPTARITVNTDSGVAPLAVNLSGTSSTDVDGSIAWYIFEDGDGGTVRCSTMSHTYESLGVYNAELTVFDDDGIPHDTFHTIQVVPDDENIYLSLWIKDTWRETTPIGYFSIHVLLDTLDAEETDTLWQDDVCGDSGWIHVVKDITTNVGGSDSVWLTLEAYCEQNESAQFLEIEIYFDDIAIFWGDVVNGNFEDDADPWTYEYNGTGFLAACYFIPEDPRSRNRSAMITQQYNTNAVAGAYGRIKRKIDIIGQ